MLGGDWDIARGGGQALHGAEKDGGGRESGVGRTAWGRIKTPGAGEVFLP